MTETQESVGRMSSHKLPAKESICFSVSNPNFCLRPRFCEVLASRSRNLGQLGEVNYVSKGYQMLPHSDQKKRSFSPTLHQIVFMWLFSGMSASPHLYGAWICCRSKYPDPTTTHSRTFPNTQWAPSLQHNSNWETLWPGARLRQVIHVQLQNANHGEWWKNPAIFDDFCGGCWIYLELVSRVDR